MTLFCTSTTLLSTHAIEDSAGGGRTLDATGLYSQSKAASAMATAHLRHQLTVELGVGAVRLAGTSRWGVC